MRFVVLFLLLFPLMIFSQDVNKTINCDSLLQENLFRIHTFKIALRERNDKVSYLEAKNKKLTSLITEHNKNLKGSQEKFLIKLED